MRRASTNTWPCPCSSCSGASGTGKSTLALRLQRPETEFLPLDGDLLWRQEFAGQGNGAFFTMWMQTALNASQGGKP